MKKVSWDDDIPIFVKWKKSPNVPNHQPAYMCEVCVCRYLGIDRDRQTDRQTDKQIDTYTFVIGYKNKNWVAATKKKGTLIKV